MSPNFKLLSTAGLVAIAVSFAAFAFADQSTVQERLAPVGDVCMAGEQCAASQAVSADTGPRSGEQVYESKCASCHVSGVAGAPIVGQADEWTDRISKGMDTLYDHAWNGFNAMPPKGLCTDCTREELDAAVDYMVENSQ